MSADSGTPKGVMAVMCLLAMGEAGERAVLAFEEHAGEDEHKRDGGSSARELDRVSQYIGWDLQNTRSVAYDVNTLNGTFTLEMQSFRASHQLVSLVRVT